MKGGNASLSYLKSICFNKINLYHPYWNDNNVGQRHSNKLLKDKFSKIKSLDKGTVEIDESNFNRNSFKKSNQIFFGKYFSDSTSFKIKDKVSTTPDLFTINDFEEILSDILDELLPMIKK